jgi:subtilisin family serine protease
MGRKSVKNLGFLMILFMVIAFTGVAICQDSQIPEYVPGELLVKFKSGAMEEDIASLKADLGLQTIKVFKRIAVHHLNISRNMAVEEVIDLLSRTPLVVYAAPNYIRYLDRTTPNDPMASELWGLHNIGQTGGTPDADIDAPEVWDLETGSSDVVVAVIDSGIDLFHEDLAANLWTNPGEIPGNGLDDDGNGYTDDVHGWDFRDNDNNPTDPSIVCSSHGTHVAGTIGAAGDNGVGVVGVNWNVKIMPLRCFAPMFIIFCSANDADIIEAIQYYTDFGIRVSNNSYGGGPPNPAMADAIRASRSVFVAAAGNDNQNTDVNPHYPSNYPLHNIVSVAATNHNDQRASFSNFGNQSVDLGAPGENILSTIMNDNYGLLSGTSMASPHVAGAAALLLANDPDLTNMEIKWHLLKGTDPIGLPVLTGGRLNVYNSLLLVTDIEVELTPITSNIIHPGDSVEYQITMMNLSDDSKSGTAMVFTVTPSGSEITIEGPFALNLAAGESVSQTFIQVVPVGAPLGNYSIIGRVWTSGFDDFDEDEEVYQLTSVATESG